MGPDERGAVESEVDEPIAGQLATDRSRRRIFLLNTILWPCVLVGLPVALRLLPNVHEFVPDPLGPVPLMIPWWGALGGLLISIRGVLKNRANWDRSYDYWHYVRVPLSAVAGTIAYLIVLLVVPSVEIPPTNEDLVFFYVVAFIAGFKEDLFFSLVQGFRDQISARSARVKGQ